MSKVYKCKDCGKEYTFWDGVGFNYPSVFLEVRTDAIEGKYGFELQKLVTSNPNIAIDASNKIYYCPDCEFWDIETTVDCYLPKANTENAPAIPWSVANPAGGLSSDEYAQVKLVTPWELKKNYTLLKVYPHNCPKCGKTMKKFSNPPKLEDNSTVLKLHCISCNGELMETNDEIYID